jgi:hypothetical protein
MRNPHALILALLALIVAACATVTAPQTPKQRLAYVDSQFTAVVETAIELRQQGILTDAHVRRLQPTVNQAHQALSLAWAAMGKGNPESALEYVAVINELLFQIRNVLEEARHEQDGSRT